MGGSIKQPTILLQIPSCMLIEQAFVRYLRCLITKEWIQTRANPQSKWNRTIQYRVNVKKIQHDLIALGHHLSELSLWGLEDILLREDLETAENEQWHFASSNGIIVLSRVIILLLRMINVLQKRQKAAMGILPLRVGIILSRVIILLLRMINCPPEMAENSNGHFAHFEWAQRFSRMIIWPLRKSNTPPETTENSNGQNAHFERA